MIRRLFKKSINLIKQNNGQSIYLLVFFLLPLIFFVPMAALDFNMYTSARGELQNALDTAAQAALSQSTADDYRVDKVLYIITRSDDSNNYVNKLKANINQNFKTVSNLVSETKTTISGKGYYKKCVLNFTPGFGTTQALSTLTVDFGTTQSNYNGTLLQANDAKGTDIKITLKSYTRLPFLSMFLSIFSIDSDETGLVEINTTSNIRGIRVKAPDDFETREWENY